MVLTPGLRFLARNLLFPTLLILLARGLANATFGSPLSIWTALWVSAVAAVSFVVVSTAARSAYHEVQAKSMGARLAPRVKGRWPGNVDVLRYLLATYETGYLGEGFYEIVDALGPVFNLEFLWSSHIFTVSPEHIQIILATDFDNYVKGRSFNSDGEMWSFHRSMTRPYFARDRVRHFEIFDRHAEKTISLIKSRMNDDHAVDFQDLISRFTMDAATEFLFGTCVDSLSAVLPLPYNAARPPTQQVNDFPTAFGDVMLQIAFRERVGWVWPLLEIFGDRTAKSMKTVRQFVDPIIRDAVERKKGNKEVNNVEFEGADAGDSDTLLDELLNSTTGRSVESILWDNVGARFTDLKLLRDETLNILLAGRETTMNCLTITVYFLAMYPKVAARLRDEIITVVGPSNQPSYDDIKEMKYLRAVFNETLRLYPPVPFNLRETVKATTWPSPDPRDKPIYIPAGVKIPYSVMIMQRRADLWGPDANEFDPERFLDERVNKYFVANPFQFLPFNGGPRICLGQQFAYNEMSFILIRLLQAFSSISLDVEACPPHGRVPEDWAGRAGRKGVEQFIPKAHLTMYTAGGLWVKMKEA